MKNSRSTCNRPVTILLALIAAASPLSSNQSPDLNRPPDIETLRLAKSGSDIRATCTDGTGPFGMARNSSASFGNSASLATSAAALCDFTDAGALTPAVSYFYLVADSQAPPRIMATETAVADFAARPGETIRLKGLGLANAQVTAPDGGNLPVAVNSSILVEYPLPMSALCSGWNTLVTPYGADYTSFIKVYSFLPSANNLLYDTAYYQDPTRTTRRVLFSSREGSSNRIHVFDPVTLADNPITLASTIPNPMGFSTGELTDGKTYLFYGPGNRPVSATGATSLFKLDFLQTPPVQSVFRDISFASGDIANVRATSFVAAAGGAENRVFAFNPVPTSGSQRDIRLGQEVTSGWTRWASLGTAVSGNAIARNFPAGLGVRDSFVTQGPFFFYTTTGIAQAGTTLQSRVVYYDTIPGSPPTHTLLWTSPHDSADTQGTKPWITNAAQIALERYGEEHAFVADRGNSNPPAGYAAVPARVHKLNASNCLVPADCPAAGASKAFLSSFDYGGGFTDIAGVSIEAGTDVTGGTYSKFLWISHRVPSAGFPVTGHGISQVRALREIPIKVFIGAHAAGNYPLAAPAERDVSLDKIRSWIFRMVERENRILYNVGYRLKFDPVTDLVEGVADDGVAAYPNMFAINKSSGVCSDELQAMMNSTVDPKRVDPKRINVFIVKGILKTNLGPPDDAVGVQNIFGACGTAGITEAILMTPYAAATCDSPPCAPADPIPPASDNVMGHELGHRLLRFLSDSVLTGAGYVGTGEDRSHKQFDAGGNCLAPNHLMCRIDQLGNVRFFVEGAGPTTKDDDLINITNSQQTDLILPDKGQP